MRISMRLAWCCWSSQADGALVEGRSTGLRDGSFSGFSELIAARSESIEGKCVPCAYVSGPSELASLLSVVDGRAYWLRISGSRMRMRMHARCSSLDGSTPAAEASQEARGGRRGRAHLERRDARRGQFVGNQAHPAFESCETFGLSPRVVVKHNDVVACLDQFVAQRGPKESGSPCQ